MSTKKIILLVTILVGGITIIPVNAAQLDVTIPSNSEKIIPTFQITRIVTIQYDSSSKLAELVGEDKHSIELDIDSENSRTLVNALNLDLQKKSFSKVTDISGKYSAIIIPQKESVTIEYKIILQPTIQGHLSQDYANILDMSWRGFEVSKKIPITIEDKKYDINSPKSVLDMVLPEVSEFISDSNAEKILSLKLIDSSGISDLPLSEWESMFDPTAMMAETSSYGFSGNIITNYSMGICTIYQGICQDKDFEDEFEIEGETYQIKSIESQDDATIVIEGYVKESTVGGKEVFSISDEAPSRGNENDTQVPALYGISAIGIVIAAGFFVWSNKKSKTVQTEQTGIDPKDLQAIPIDGSAGSYKTNRATASLKQNT